jgi:hypothetical protein
MWRRGLSKRARVAELRSSMGEAPVQNNASDASFTDAIVLWRGAAKKRTQVRLMATVAGVQFFLGMAYFQSLKLVRTKEADKDYMKEKLDGNADARERTWTEYLTWTDYALSVLVGMAPFILLTMSHFSCGRWINELKLLSQNTAMVETFNILGQRVQRNVPVAQLQRSAKFEDRFYIRGAPHIFPEGGEFFNKAVFVRTFREHQ